jgi:hypothetical protein
MEGSDELVAVVAARHGYGEYLAASEAAGTGVYVCRAGRALRPAATRLGFYQAGAIRQELPRIIGACDVTLDAGEAAALAAGDELDRRAGAVIPSLLAGGRPEGERVRLVLLLAAGDADTLRLGAPVPHDRDGRGFTRDLRYVALAALLAGPASTADLVAPPPRGPHTPAGGCTVPPVR